MKIVPFAASLLLLLSMFHVNAQEKTDKEKLLTTFHSISSNEILGYVEELSAPQYKGRLSGSPEYMAAAEWCAGKFREWGIQPANNGSYFQFFKNEYSEVPSLGEVIYSNGDNKRTLKFPDEYLPGSNSASGTVDANLVYVGYGITAPELDYDDYKNVDVKGKIIVLESGIPYTKNDTTMAKWTPYAYHRYKFRNAVKHGAAGMIYTNLTANPNTVNIDGFVYAHVSPDLIGQIFSDAGKDYAETQKQLQNGEIPSFAFGAGQKIKITAQTKYFPDARSCNVVGMIEGSDPVLKEEVIIIGGHLDGQGQLGDVAFPSALDNGSGVADILGAAKAFASSEIKPERSILFILIGGEECGLYGSKYYAENPLFPITKTRLMINLDMVGNGTGFFLTGGKTYVDLYRHFETANEAWIHRKLQTNAVTKNYGRPRSDASNFENAGIPTFSLWTSGSVYPVYYHHPKDKTDVLTPEIMEDAAKLLYLGVMGIANEGGN
ncbi:M28 family peptidase [Maribellus sp. YY47]|uniref:M28 family peptidase n=1 Tax=Maribellus sp. YY47 TaxID=2929486 RepID=UPI00200132AB|nr:M28 family peptidase [Maribellus sp. YY47]MCK3685970.1 M28 family peptidase [Maribellus sp. YY47]